MVSEWMIGCRQTGLFDDDWRAFFPRCVFNIVKFPEINRYIVSLLGLYSAYYIIQDNALVEERVNMYFINGMEKNPDFSGGFEPHLI